MSEELGSPGAQASAISAAAEMDPRPTLVRGRSGICYAPAAAPPPARVGVTTGTSRMLLAMADAGSGVGLVSSPSAMPPDAVVGAEAAAEGSTPSRKLPQIPSMPGMLKPVMPSMPLPLPFMGRSKSREDARSEAAPPPEGGSKIKVLPLPTNFTPILLSTIRDILPTLIDTFEAIDVDDSGSLSIDEFETVMRIEGLTAMQAQQIFQTLDITGDGFVTMREIQMSAQGAMQSIANRKKKKTDAAPPERHHHELSFALLQRIADSLPQLIQFFESADTDASGSLGVAEFTRCATKLGLNEQQSKQLFHALDHSSDQSITIKELVASHTRLTRAADKARGREEEEAANTSCAMCFTSFGRRRLRDRLLGYLWHVDPDVTADRVEEQRPGRASMHTHIDYEPGVVDIPAHCKVTESKLTTAVEELLTRVADMRASLRNVALKRHEISATQMQDADRNVPSLSRQDALVSTLWQAIEGSAVRLEPFAPKADPKQGLWSDFAPPDGMERRAKWAARFMIPVLGCAIGFCAFLYYQLPQDKATPLTSGGAMTALLEQSTGALWLFCLASPVAVAASAFLCWKNVQKQLLVYLALAPQVPIMMVQMVIRVQVYFNIYGSVDTQFITTLSLFWSISLFFLFCLFIVMDIFLVPRPFLRLVIGITVIAMLFVEIVGRDGYDIIAERVTPTSSSILNTWLGATGQTFLYTLDKTVLTLFITSFYRVVRRPLSCALIVIPCTTSECLFKYRQERRTMLHNGNNRAQGFKLRARMLKGTALAAPGAVWSRFTRRHSNPVVGVGDAADEEAANAENGTSTAAKKQQRRSSTAIRRARAGHWVPRRRSIVESLDSARPAIKPFRDTRRSSVNKPFRDLRRSSVK